MAVSATDRYRMVREKTWQWSRQLSWVKKLGLALGMACMIGLLSQLRIVLPWTPVPITGQTFGVLLAAALLGRWWGGASLAMYVGLGVAGLPWFNGLTGGIQSIAGPTGGYLIGFVLAALFLGFVTEKYIKARSVYRLFGLMLVADFIFVFGPGLLQLNLWLNMVKPNSAGVYHLLALGLIPFIAGEIIKVAAAAAGSSILMPKEKK